MNLRPDDVRFDERGLVPAVVQDARTREVLTLAYMNEESLRRTLAERETWFWSRSRGGLWHKGETSGHTQRVVEVRLDCDSDALVVLVEPRGPACHTSARTCFHRQLGEAGPRESPASDKAGENGVPALEGELVSDEVVEVVAVGEVGGGAGEGFGVVVEKLFAVVESRRRERPENSYTTYLFEQGLNKILKKVGEESAETIIAAKDEDREALTCEMSDLVYHLVVLMIERGITLDALGRELARRGRGRVNDE
ncbi:MAG: phosphoribosyl-AMP cyclohydrolase [Acidobacteriota bacterium]|nr:phosphoribosyl-AMP cyclohydrolase [Acidobacteriota bacterium]